MSVMEDLELAEIIALGGDLTPIPLPDQTNAISPILYRQEYADAMSYLRAVMAEREYSTRSLLLTDYLIKLNPAHYTVWTFRFDILSQLSTLQPLEDDGEEGTTDRQSQDDWSEETTDHQPQEDRKEGTTHRQPQEVWRRNRTTEEGDAKERRRKELWVRELRYIESLAADSSKNYQLWHHRELVQRTLDHLDVPAEKAFLWKMLQGDREEEGGGEGESDGKNYHVWSYRQWLCKFATREFVPGEAEVTETLIHTDIYNNSAWNHRFFVLFEVSSSSSSSSSSQGGAETARGKKDNVGRNVDMDSEWQFVQSIIRLDPSNDSPWSYLSAILKVVDSRRVEEAAAAAAARDGGGETWRDRESLIQFAQEFQDSVPALDFLVTQYELEQDDEQAKSCLSRLASLDTIRVRYWHYRLSLLTSSTRSTST